MTETTFHCDGRIVITVEPREMRMSHWLCTPRVFDRKREQVLLDLSGSLWDLAGTADETAEGIRLMLRKYPGDRAAVVLSLDLASDELRLSGYRVSSSQLLSALDTAMERAV